MYQLLSQLRHSKHSRIYKNPSKFGGILFLHFIVTIYTILMEKLIRDNIIEIAKSKWETLIHRIVFDTKELIWFLLQKLDEELWEYDTAGTPNEREEEAGDVLEVIDTLISKDSNWYIHSTTRADFIQKCSKDNLNIESILAIQQKKREIRWWFEKGIILIH